jgi:hypothetical protein
MDRQAASPAEAGPFRLRECRQVSVCDLTGAERFIVWAIRWRAARHDDEAFAAACLQDSFDRAGLSEAQPAFERFVAAARDTPLHCPAAQRLGCWRLSPLEAHALHAIACLQSGILGEAWKALAAVCPRPQASRALQPLHEVATCLARVGGTVNRWRFEEEGAATRLAAAPA